MSVTLNIGPKPVQPDPYDAVLADLRAKRDALDAHITFLESIRDSRLGVAPAAASAMPQSEGEAEASEDEAGMFLGMSIVDAAKKLLKLRKRQLGNAEILQNLQAGGMVLTGADPLNVVSSVLTRRFNTVGDVVRVSRGTWGLKEWYPGRNFGRSPGKALVSGVYKNTEDGFVLESVPKEEPASIEEVLG